MKFSQVDSYMKYTIYEDGTVLNHVDYKIMGRTECRGRYVVSLTNNSKSKKTWDISQLVAKYFVENNVPEGKKAIVGFKDKDHSNIHANNLEWIAKGDDLRKFTEEQLKERRKYQHCKSRRKRDRDGSVKKEQRLWRQTPKGHFTRRRNHWIDAGMTEPEEGWEDYHNNTFEPSTHCELCNSLFNTENDYMSQRCLDHDHFSGHIRFICCRRCNSGFLRKHDIIRQEVMLELHRYFNRNN